MKKLTKEGVGVETMQAQPLTPEQEEKLWCLTHFRCVLLGASPCNTVFWYNCKLFGLRGEDEHRSLVREQFEVNSQQQGRFLRFRGPRVFITVNRKTWLVDVVFPQQTASGWLGGHGVLSWQRASITNLGS